MSSIVLLFEPGTDIIGRAAARAGAAHAGAREPERLAAAADAPAAVVGEPGDDDRALAEAAVADRGLGARPLDDPAAPAGRRRRGERRDLRPRDRQLQVLVDPERLRDNERHAEQVIRTAGNAQLVSPLSFLEASTPGTGGFIDTANQRLQVRHILPTVTPGELARCRSRAARRRRARCAWATSAEVVEDHQPLIGDAIVSGGTGLLLVVEKFPGANTLEVTRDVEDALDELRPGLAGMQIDSPSSGPADFIDEAIDNLTLAVIVGVALLALVLFALLFEWRAALVCLARVRASR